MNGNANFQKKADCFAKLSPWQEIIVLSLSNCF